VLKKFIAFLLIFVFLSMIVTTKVNFVNVTIWSNGDFSSNPSNPDYGMLPDRSPPDGIGGAATKHTFQSDTEVLEHYIDVPFYYQTKAYYCGPAALQMVFDFYGENISQLEIAEVARTVGYPLYSTYTDEMRRAAHFSNVSTSMGSQMPENITGYTARKIGYAAFEWGGMTLDELKALIAQNFPIILLMRWIPEDIYGHYRVAVGYNQTHIFVHDPWNNIKWGQAPGGPNLAMNYTFFLNMWDYSGHWALFVSPWKIDIDIPKVVYAGNNFTVTTNITYPCPSPFPSYEYLASSCKATIILQEGLILAEGENATKELGDLQAQIRVQTFWTVNAKYSGDYNITLEVEGNISGIVGGKPNVGPGYFYQDRIGGSNSSIIEALDGNPPYIGIPTQEPPRDMVMPYQNVTVSVNITDFESGVKNASLLYNLNNGSEWIPTPMDLNLTSHFYYATILGQPEETYVRFKIVAYDYAENNATKNGEKPYCTYQVIPEYPSIILPLLFLVSVVLTALYINKRILRKKKNIIQDHEYDEIGNHKEA